MPYPISSMTRMTTLAKNGVPSDFHLVSSGLLASDNFANLLSWGNQGTWASVEDRRISAYPISRMMFSPGVGTSDAGGVRESHMVDSGNGVYYLFYGAGDGSAPGNGSWKVQLAKSVDYGKTWTRLGVKVGLSKDFTAGNWAARDNGFVHKVGDTYYLTVVDAATSINNVPGVPYEESIYTSSSLEGTWTYAGRGAVLGAGGAYNDYYAAGGCVVLNGETYYRFYTASEGSDVGIGMMTANAPDGTWIDQGKRTLLQEGQPENPKVFWSELFQRWIMLDNQIHSGGTLTDRNRLHVSASLTDWSAANPYDFMWRILDGFTGGNQPCNIDTTQGDVMGLASPLYLESGLPAFDGNTIPFTYDAYPTDGNHHGRKILGGVLEQNLYSLYYSGVAEQNIQRVVSHSDFVAEFSMRFTAQTNTNAQISFLYRRASVVGSTQNGYQLAVIPAGAGNSSIELGKFVGGSYSQIARTTGMQFQLGRQYRIRLEVVGSNHKLYVDNVLIINNNDTQFSSGQTVAFKGYQCTAYVWGFHIRTSNTITINNAPSAVNLHAPGGIYVAEHQTSITHTHYPMGALSVGSVHTKFQSGIYGGDVYEYVGA